MNVKEIRKLTGMTQSSFAKKYRIPLQTLKQWESNKDSKSYRKPPEYVEFLLQEVVQNAIAEQQQNEAFPISEAVTHVIRTAKDSRRNAKLWLRYIAKHFEADHKHLSSSELKYLLTCNDLTMFQKCALKSAYQNGTKTNQYVAKLSQRCDTSFAEKLLERSRKNVRQ